MKKSLLLLFAALATLVVGCQKEEGLEDQGKENSPSIDYLFDLEDRTAKVKGFIGDCPESITIPSTISHGGVNYRVESIEEEAFKYCSSLKSINIPKSVTSIGNGAFYSCYSLTTITIPENVTNIGSNAFAWCSSLTAITIPKSVTSIGDYAFSYCGSLTAITILEGVTSIGDYAFA